jgi:hypothetical protein
MLEECGRFAMVADVSRLVRNMREGSRCFSNLRRHAVAVPASLACYPNLSPKSLKMLVITLSTQDHSSQSLYRFSSSTPEAF